MAENYRPQFAFIGKYIIKADIELKTGLHIGGTEEGFDIGGIDNPVIKDKISGIPYIPGSSLKGKIRSLLEWLYNKVDIKKNDKTNEWEGKLCSDPSHSIGIVFGVAAENHKGDLPGPTRLAVRDAYPDKDQVARWEAAMGEKIFTEAKTENAIDRLTSAANPRSMERVPAESVFKAEFIYDLYCHKDRDRLKLLFEGIRLLEDSYLGGSGTRGSGKVAFTITEIVAKDKSVYTGAGELLLKAVMSGKKTAEDVFKSFDTIFPKIEA